MKPGAIQIHRQDLSVDRAQIADLQSRFAATHCLLLPKLLEPSLLDFVQRRFDHARWQTMVHDSVGVEYVLDDGPALTLLHFVANLPKFRGVMEAITGCRPLRRFHGRVYRMVNREGHYDSWHDDNLESRAVGMTLNLSSCIFHGGAFVIRERQSARILMEATNTGLGDALIFRISDKLEHRISAIEGDEPKTAFAGWFQSDGPELFEEMRSKSGIRGTGGCSA